jgi:hypothetical protein
VVIAIDDPDARRHGARLVPGEHRSFGLGRGLRDIEVPHLPIDPVRSASTRACGVALHCPGSTYGDMPKTEWTVQQLSYRRIGFRELINLRNDRLAREGARPASPGGDR